jgi:hypothetical protein
MTSVQRAIPKVRSVTVSKIIDALKDFKQVSRCAHEFAHERSVAIGGGEVGRCIKCRARFTVWPGTVHYDEIVGAKRREKR